MSAGDQTTPYRFSNEELRVLQQCNSESFFQRCLPIATFMGVGTYYGVKGGLLQPNSKYGAVPKVIASVVLGYILGKFSYQGKCAEKLMAIPDSKLGAMLREKKRKGYQESLTMDEPGFGKTLSELPPSEKFSDISNPPPSSHMDIDTDRPHQSGTMDDTYRPVLDDSHMDEEQALPPVHLRTTTYEELRRKNREDYELKKTKPYRGVLTPDDVPSALKTKDSVSEPPPPNLWSKGSNKYGDVWDK